MNRKQAEDYIYQSYMKADAFHDYSTPDSMRRHPEHSRALIRSLPERTTLAVTGSKGKGSAAYMIACLLQTKGCTGLMTSPHIRTFNERFRIDGRIMTDEELIRHVSWAAAQFEPIEQTLPSSECISPIGIQTAVALHFFEEQQARFRVLECGKGARYDDVNNVAHQYAMINSIFLEHTRELGSTLEEIAADKACIMTEETRTAFIGRQEPEVLEVLRQRAQETGCVLRISGEDFAAEHIRMTKAGMDFDVRTGRSVWKDLHIPLLGEHQARNAAMALAAAEEILADEMSRLANRVSAEYVYESWRGDIGTDDMAAQSADITGTDGGADGPGSEQTYEPSLQLTQEEVRHVFSGLNWPGRMQIISIDPLVILDACINRKSTAPAREVLSNLGIDEVTTVVGIPDDKDYEGVALAMRDITGDLILTRSQNPHYRFTALQQERLQAQGMKARRTETVTEAMDRIRKIGRPAVILGTTSVVAEVISQLS